ncbi:MAG: DAK2 domain-containing protein [Erysipelothrix sp.]|nr:DAK2 domain-containing protein [Erysipelothrix sp.]
MDKLTAIQFKEMIESGRNNLFNHYQEIDQLNVFPVPDGDTGTNMNLTFTNGLNDIRNSSTDHIGQLSKEFSRGLLMGARGNSGVILSQIFRGISQAMVEKETINSKDLALALDTGREVAYKAVMRPVEGTILTVMRMAGQKVLEFVNNSKEPLTIIETFDYFMEEAQIALDYTPELLPVLKEVGVVDSGGAGLLKIFEGFQASLYGKPIEASSTQQMGHVAVQTQFEHDEFGYCTEFIIQLNDQMKTEFNESRFRNEISKQGDSLVVVRDEDIVKVHIHTLKPGDALNFGQRFGEFVRLKIENMTEQHQAILVEEAHGEVSTNEHKKYAIVSVCAGDGLATYFKDLRVDKIIAGGQTMNPSTEDFVAAIQAINADHIIILPNNSNIFMAAKQTAEVLEDKDITVIETKSIPHGLSACISFNPEVSLEENIEAMTEAVNDTKAGSITYAIKDTSIDSVEIKAGEYMALVGKEIIVSVSDKDEALMALVDSMIDEESEIITLIAGEDIEENHAQELAETLEEKHDLDVELVLGGQPVYSYMVGVE